MPRAEAVALENAELDAADAAAAAEEQEDDRGPELRRRRGRAAASDEAFAAMMVPPPLPAVYEDVGGKVRVRGRPKPVGKITCFHTNVSAACQIPGHGARCRRAYAFNRIPRGPCVFLQWIADGLELSSAAEHMGLPKPQRYGP